MWQYKANVIKVYDGDTITVNIDLGFGIVKLKEKIRLYGIDAAEMQDLVNGLKSKNMLSELILNKDITLETIKDKKEKYGRYLAKIYLDGVLINDILLKTQGTKEYYGTGKREALSNETLS